MSFFAAMRVLNTLLGGYVVKKYIPLHIKILKIE